MLFYRQNHKGNILTQFIYSLNAYVDSVTDPGYICAISLISCRNRSSRRTISKGAPLSGDDGLNLKFRLKSAQLIIVFSKCMTPIFFWKHAKQALSKHQAFTGLSLARFACLFYILSGHV